MFALWAGLAGVIVTLLLQLVSFAFFIGGLKAQVKALEAERPVANELNSLLSGLVATVGGLKDLLAANEQNTDRRFKAIEDKLDELRRGDR